MKKLIHFWNKYGAYIGFGILLIAMIVFHITGDILTRNIFLGVFGGILILTFVGMVGDMFCP